MQVSSETFIFNSDNFFEPQPSFSSFENDAYSPRYNGFQKNSENKFSPSYLTTGFSDPQEASFFSSPAKLYKDLALEPLKLIEEDTIFESDHKHSSDSTLSPHFLSTWDPSNTFSTNN